MSQKNNPKTLNGLQRLLEGGLILCCMIAVFILLALGSFHASDPSWSQANYDGNVKNITGAVGAWTADILLYFLGYVAYLCPILIAGAGWLVFHRRLKFVDVNYFSVGLRIIGFFIMILSLAAIASMNADNIYEFSAGGVAGDIIKDSMLPYFNKLGTTLLLLCFVIAGFILLTGISLFSIIDYIVRGSIWSYFKIKSSIEKWLQENKIDEDETPIDERLVIENTVWESDDIINGQATEIIEEDEPTKKTSFLNKLKNRKPEIQQEEPEDVELIDFDDIVSFGGDVNEPTAASTSSVAPAKPAPKPQAKPAPKKARIENGVVLLPGEDEPKLNVPMDPLPSISLLDVPNRKKNPITPEELEKIARLVEIKLADFNIVANVVGVFPGPVITRFELELAPGVKASKITNLSKDLARSLLSENVRVVEVIPGKPYVGLELPNKFRETVFLRDVLDSDTFRDSQSNLTMVLGQDIAGEPVIADLAKMPHLLVAGTTGSGKSVGVNVMITSILYKSGPEDVRFIMIDPKMLELSVYEGIPHLLCEVVTDMKEAANALRWCVGEMERRYKLMSSLGVRNLKGYNAKIKAAIDAGEPIEDPLWKPNESMDETAPLLEKLPSIVVVVDEFADMMMIVGKKVEELIARIAQKARAAGIHLILATQRPSVDVITGLIKANVPTRIAFQVSSRIDSRTILDQQGAETLLGMGDMLYLPSGTSIPTRVHGAFVDDHEVHNVVADWHARGKPQYLSEILNGGVDGEQVLLPGEKPENEEELDALYDEAVAFVTETRKGSISSVQRKFKIGYNRAARIIEQMELQGIVSPQGNNGNREVLAPPPPR